MGFEPTAPCGDTGFRDQLLRPLGPLSSNVFHKRKDDYTIKGKKCQAFFEKSFYVYLRGIFINFFLKCLIFGTYVDIIEIMKTDDEKREMRYIWR